MIQTGQRSTMNGGEKILGVQGGGTKTCWVLVKRWLSRQGNGECGWVGTHSGRCRRRLFSQLASPALDPPRIRSPPRRSPVHYQNFARIGAEQSERTGALGADRRQDGGGNAGPCRV